MTESILKAVAGRLKEKYEDIKIYNDIVKQGFKTPCFCISVADVCDSLFRGRRYKYCGTFEIRYYADSRTDMSVRAEELFKCLESVYAEDIGMVIGSNMKAEECEQYYKFVVCYEFFYIKNEDVDVMGKFNFEIKL